MEREPKAKMSDRGKAYLWELVYRFRRQIGDKELVEHADWVNKRNRRGRHAVKPSMSSASAASPSAQ
jgi:hypothetical protein